MIEIRLGEYPPLAATDGISLICCPDCGGNRIKIRTLPHYGRIPSLEGMRDLECILTARDYVSKSGLTWQGLEGQAKDASLEVFGRLGRERAVRVRIVAVVPDELVPLFHEGDVLAKFRAFCEVFGLNRKSSYCVIGHVLPWPEMPTQEVVCGRCRAARIEADPDVRRQGHLLVSSATAAIDPWVMFSTKEPGECQYFNHRILNARTFVRLPFAIVEVGHGIGPATISSPDHPNEEIVLKKEGQRVICYHPWPEQAD